MQMSLKMKVYKLTHNIQLFCTLRNAKRSLIIYDIDNTIADTWRQLGSSKNDPKKIYRNLLFFPSMLKRIQDDYKIPSNRILFFTVRPIGTWLITLRWLISHKLPVKWHDLFFFSSPTHKIDLLESLVKRGYEIIFIDDLSYNHENGNVLFFVEEIKRVQNMPLIYKGLTEILAIQNDSDSKLNTL